MSAIPKKPLFYQNGRRPYILESLSTTSGQFYIRRGYKDALMSAKDITTIGGAKEVYVTYDKAEADGIYKTVYEKLPKQQTYDITAHLVSKSNAFDKYAKNSGLNQKSDREKQMWMGSASQTQLVNEILKNVSIIAVCENINVKYDVTYTISFQAANNQADITEIKPSALTEDDYKQIKETNA